MPALVRDFNYQNPMQVPRVAKVSVNVGVGEAIANAKALDATVRDVSIITGQKPVIKKARKSIAQFKLREGQNVGVMVTLRGERMWEFLDRLMNAALPRTRDFRGVPSRSFDGRGNFTLGLREQLIFPEINYDQVDKARGLEVSIITTASTDQEARRLLELLGMPFQREGETSLSHRRPRPAPPETPIASISRLDALASHSIDSVAVLKGSPVRGLNLTQEARPLWPRNHDRQSRTVRRASKRRQHNRCQLCGRPRAFIRRFTLCRICFRKLALAGEIPGVTKASW